MSEPIVASFKATYGVNFTGKLSQSDRHFLSLRLPGIVKTPSMHPDRVYTKSLCEILGGLLADETDSFVPFRGTNATKPQEPQAIQLWHYSSHS